MDKRVHYKMYKAGKSWVIAGLALTGFFGVTANVQANEVQPAAAMVQTASQASMESGASQPVVKSAESAVKSAATSDFVAESATFATSVESTDSAVPVSQAVVSETSKSAESAVSHSVASSSADKASNITSQQSHRVSVNSTNSLTAQTSIAAESAVKSEAKPSQPASVAVNVQQTKQLAAPVVKSRATNLNLLAAEPVASSDFLTTAKNLASQSFIDNYVKQNGQAAMVVMIQNWLNTYRVISLAGVNIINSSFSGSIAAIAGGIHVVGTPAKITPGNDNQWGTIANGGVTSSKNTVTFDTTTILSDRPISNQSTTEEKFSRPTGSGAITGIDASQFTVDPQALNIADFYQAFTNLSVFYSSLLDKNSVLPNNRWGKLAKSDIGSIGTKDLGMTAGKHVYVVNFDLTKWPSVETSGFTDSDIVIYNVVSSATKINLNGGFSSTTDNLIWNFATATRVENTTTIKGKIVAPHAVVTTNQNVDSAGVLQYGYGGSGATQSAIAAKNEVNYQQSQTVQEKPLDYLYAVIDKNGNVYDTKTALQGLTGLTYTITDCATNQVVADLQQLDTSKSGQHRYQVTYKYDGIEVVTYINIIPDTSQVTDTINYIDENGKAVHTDSKEGQNGTATNLALEIPANYVLDDSKVSDTIPVKFGSRNQTISVYVKAKTTQTTQSKTVTQTIHYVDLNEKQLAADHIAKITFSRTVITNLATEVVTYGEWSSSSAFADVNSPIITGYTPNSETVTDTHKDTDEQHTFTVKYRPNEESASIKYVDDTTQNELKTDHISGLFGATIDYQTAVRIADYEKNGYQLVFDGFSVAGSRYDFDSPTAKTFIVHLKQKSPVVTTDTKVVSQKVHYRYANGQIANPDQVNQVTFSRNAIYNPVTKQTTYGKWNRTAATASSLVSPTLTGYTPDHSVVACLKNYADQAGDLEETVTYTPNHETAIVIYQDTTTGEKLQVQELTGAYGTTSDYQTAGTIAEYVSCGYNLLTNGYPQDSLIFGHDGQRQQFVINLQQRLQNKQEQRSIKQTIHYQYQSGKTASSDQVREIGFYRTQSINQVTGKTINGEWQRLTDQALLVQTPKLIGYTPDQNVVDLSAVAAETGAGTQLVTYMANRENAEVRYVDETSGQVLKVQQLDGTYGTTDSYRTAIAIAALEKQGYQLVNDDYPNAGVIYNQDGLVQRFVVHLRAAANSVDPTTPTQPEVPVMPEQPIDSELPVNPSNPTLPVAPSGQNDPIVPWIDGPTGHLPAGKLQTPLVHTGWQQFRLINKAHDLPAVHWSKNAKPSKAVTEINGNTAAKQASSTQVPWLHSDLKENTLKATTQSQQKLPELPQTDEQSESSVSILAGLITLILSCFGYRTRKK